jgi:membrane-associated phospholipid phosphatase
MLRPQTEPAACAPVSYHRATGLARCLAGLALALLSGCATLPDGHRWGQDVGVPSWQRVGQAAWHSVRNPAFWVPLAAAGAMQIDNWDHRVSRWARRRTPVFGSQNNAGNWSGYLRSVSVVAGWASILLAPSGPFDGQWWLDKVKGSAVDIAAAESAIEFTSGLQRLARRARPSGYLYPGDTSMPSDHTATAAIYDAIAAQNVQLSGLSPGLKTAADVSLGALTAATGWARIEASAHFPSDTLVGAAIGDFFANFFTAAFLAPADGHADRIAVAALPGGAELQLQVLF